MHKFLFYNKFIVFICMFRALLCSSSGGQNCIIQHLGSSHTVGGRAVHRLGDDWLLASSCPSVRLSSAWNTSAPTGRIFIKFDI